MLAPRSTVAVDTWTFASSQGTILPSNHTNSARSAIDVPPPPDCDCFTIPLLPAARRGSAAAAEVQFLRRVEEPGPQIAAVRKPVEHRLDRPPQGVEPGLELVPRHRHADRRLGDRPQAVDAGDRLAARVLIVVE